MHKNRVFFDWVRSQYGTDYFYLHIVMPKSNGDMEVSEDYVWPASKFAGRPEDAFWTFIDSLKKGLRVPDPDYSGSAAERISLRSPTYNSDSAYELDLNYEWRNR